MYHKKENYASPHSSQLFHSFLGPCFCPSSFISQRFRIKKGKKTLGIYLLFLGSSLATFSLILYFFLSIVTLSLWMIGCGLICYGAYWNGKHKKLQSSPPCHSDWNRSDSYHFISPHLRKTQVLSMKT